MGRPPRTPHCRGDRHASPTRHGRACRRVGPLVDQHRTILRGDVWWIEDPRRSRRPVVILTRDVVADRMTALLVAHVTSVIRGLPTEVPLDEDDGMPRTCVISLDNVTTEPRSLLTERITHLGVERMSQVCIALAHATGC